jgi:hypothetical protein
MDAEDRYILENIIMNLKNYKECPRREQLEHKIKITMAFISAILEEDEKEKSSSGTSET